MDSGRPIQRMCWPGSGVVASSQPSFTRGTPTDGVIELSEGETLETPPTYIDWKETRFFYSQKFTDELDGPWVYCEDEAEQTALLEEANQAIKGFRHES